MRKKSEDRCQKCLMRCELCICELIPSIELSTRVLIVVSHREFRTPSNTGRLAGMALKNSHVFLRGVPDKPYDLDVHLGPEGRNFVVFPSEDATVLSAAFASDKNPATLIFPDSNWRGASKMCQRDPTMAKLPRVKLPLGMPSLYKIRHESKLGGLATLEAIARSIGILESRSTQIKLEDLLAAKVNRTLSSRGKLF